MDPNNSWVSLATQIPLVGLFIWFSLRLITLFQSNLERRDKDWRAFLTEQRQENHASLAAMASRFSDEIHCLTSEVQQLKGTLWEHLDETATQLNTDSMPGTSRPRK
jgi:hypothetical protein